MRRMMVGWITATGLIILSLVLVGCAAMQPVEEERGHQGD
jgi:hypothetical protein